VVACYSWQVAKSVIHARLTGKDREVLADLKRATGASDSELVRRGLRLIQRDLGGEPSARDLAGSSAGRFRGGPPDLATNPDHLDGFGQ
jgi:hypothetical protein